MAPVDPQVSSETIQASCSDLSRRKRVRLVHVDRRQLIWTILDVERLVDEDHPVRRERLSDAASTIPAFAG